MALKPSAKKKLGLLGIALAALAIDRGLLFSGGSDANAQSATGPASGQTQTAPQQKNPSTAPAIEVASVMETLREVIAQESPDRDAFRLPEILAAQQETETDLIPVPQGDAQDTQRSEPAPRNLPSFEVTSIIASSMGEPMAVINGTPIRVGQTRNGITLVSVSTRTATIRYADREVEVRLSTPR